MSTVRTGSSRFAPVGTLSPRRPAQIAQLDAVPIRERAQLLVAREELVQAVLHVQAVRDRVAEERTPGGREATALGGDADEGGGRLEAERVVDGADDQDAVLLLPDARRVEQRDDGPLAVREHAPRRLPVVGSPLKPSARIRSRSDTEAGPVGGHLHSVDELHTGPGSLREEVAVEIDVVAERSDDAAGGDPQPRLDHAAEHHTEPECAGGVGHAHRFADATRQRA